VLVNEVLSIDVGHLFSEEGASDDFIPRSALESFPQEYGSCYEEVRVSLETSASPVTRSFVTASAVPAIKAVAEDLRTKYENILVLGIGGSTLGFRTILQSLRGPFHNLQTVSTEWPRVFVLDNADPVLASHLGELLDFKRTALIYISKSGSTPESAANFIYFYKKYRKVGGIAKDIVIICDPVDNGINHIAKDLGCHLFHIPHDLPGRYTVLSPVGFMPSELVGVDSRALLSGAEAVHRAILENPLNESALFVLGACLAELARKGKLIHVLFNYSNILSEFGLWFAQLWAESLGKRETTTGLVVNAGTTPLAALGATDQHSLLQLFKEGPNDKVYGFVTIGDFPSDVELTNEFPSEVEYSYFAGHTMSEQLNTEQISTEVSLVRAGRPCYRIVLPEISARTLGALFYFMEALVVFVARLWDVDPFDQPGVEEAKRMTYSLMGREDYASMRLIYEEELARFNNQRHIFEVRG
jgi:glucose-6-phosphate isomerase